MSSISAIRNHIVRCAVAIVLVLALLALGLWFGGHPEDLPGFIRTTFVASNNETKVVDEAIETIRKDYYRPVRTHALTSASIGGMISSLHDPYSEYLGPTAFKGFDAPTTFTGIGVSIKEVPSGLQIVHVFDGSPAARAGLQGGEVIEKANGHELGDVSLDHAVALIEGPPGSDVQLQISRHGQSKDVKLTRETIKRPVVASKMQALNGLRLGVAYLAAFSDGAHAELAQAVHRLLREGAQGLVLDMRGNGGGLVSEAQLVASLFVKSGVIVTTRGRSQPTVVLHALGGAIPSSIPMVVLVDHSTASAAEIVTAALQDHRRAVVVGTHTYGKGVFQELEPLSNGGGLKLTVGEYYTPNGRNLGGGGVKEGAGITPEVMVKSGIDTEHGLAVALHALAGEVG